MNRTGELFVRHREKFVIDGFAALPWMPSALDDSFQGKNQHCRRREWLRPKRRGEIYPGDPRHLRG
jgi:hypothetical protein